MESNWRRHRGGGGEDEDGWRTNARGEKWGKILIKLFYFIYYNF